MKICGIIEETVNGHGDDQDIVFEVALSRFYSGFIQYMLDTQDARNKARLSKISRELEA
jgi:hypothetical protein